MLQRVLSIKCLLISRWVFPVALIDMSERAPINLRSGLHWSRGIQRVVRDEIQRDWFSIDEVARMLAHATTPSLATRQLSTGHYPFGNSRGTMSYHLSAPALNR